MRSWVSPAVYVLAIAILIQNFALHRQNQSYRRGAGLPDIELGRNLSDLAAVTMDGKQRIIPLPGSQTDRLLIITMSPACPICAANREKWLGLMSKLKRRGGWRVLWASRDSLDQTKKYAETAGLDPQDILADPTYRTYLELGLDKVPQMIAVRSGGVVERVWRGRLEGQMEASLLAYLGDDFAK